MSYTRDRVIILKSDPFRESDRRLVMYGQAHGLIEAVARGASRWESKQAGHLVPMSEAEVMIAKGAAFDKLAVARVVASHCTIRRHLGALIVVGAFFDLFERLQKPGIVDVDLYDLLVEYLSIAELLVDDPTAERARLLYSAGALKLLDRIGYSPSLSSCSLCRGELMEEDHRVLPADGSVVHIDCYRSVRAQQPNADLVNHKTLALVRFLRQEPLKNVLYITGTTLAFLEASNLIAHTLKTAHLLREPHGTRTIYSILA